MATKLARIGSLARGLDLNESDQRVAEGNRVIRAGLERGDHRLADCLHNVLRETAKLGQTVDQCFERRTELVFRLPRNGDVVEFCFGLSAVASNGSLQSWRHASLLAPSSTAIFRPPLYLLACLRGRGQ